MTISLGLIATVNAQQADDPRVADIVRAGKLRAGVGVVAPHWAVKDPATGELRGVAIEIARALAKRLGVELVVVEYPSPPSETIPAGFELLQRGDADALALPRPAALQFAARLPGSRVLADRFFTTSGAMAVPKGQAGHLAYISEFIEQAKSSGLVKRVIDDVGVRGVQVAQRAH